MKWSSQVPPDLIYLSCWSTCIAIGLVGLQSSKKPIRDCFSRCRPFLKLFTVLAFTVWWSKLFHLLTSRCVKKCRLTSNLLLCLVSFNSWPLRCFVVENSNTDSIVIPERPLTILNTSVRSALLRLSSILQNPKRLSLSQYGSLEKPRIILVQRGIFFVITRWPHWCAVFNMWAYQWIVQLPMCCYIMLWNIHLRKLQQSAEERILKIGQSGKVTDMSLMSHFWLMMLILAVCV